MSNISRRKLITTGLAAAAGVSGLGVAAHLAKKYGLVPPDNGGLYGLGETLTYAAQRLLTRHSMAREFSRSQISTRPLANELAPFKDPFKRLQAGNFVDWRLTVDGLMDRPSAFSVDQLRSYPSSNQITEVVCEEGWSYIADWVGVRLAHVLDLVETRPQARYVVFTPYANVSQSTGVVRVLWDTVDMADALHPQTLLAYGMNGEDLPADHGAPVRLRLSRHLGYKNTKYLSKIVVTDRRDLYLKGRGTWYGGI